MKNPTIKIDNGVLKRYADLAYDEWYAIAEFVDNSLHSFLLHKDQLEYKGIKKCLVNVSITDNGNTIKIVDFAGGIHENDFEKLLTLGSPKEKTKTQLSEFGMGMKTAGIWLGNLIEIETKHFLEDQAFKITIDVKKAGTDNLVKIEKVINSSNEISYTKIKITELNRKIKRKKSTLEKSLASIYRKYIESGVLELKFDSIPLSPITTEIMKDPSGNLRKKDFVIELENGRKCKGWVAMMKHGVSKLAGFSIYRHDRLIRGYPENLWKPRVIFGSVEGGSNLRRSQRLFGELDMTEFRVAHTKNQINFVGSEEDEFREKLISHAEELMKLAEEKLDPEDSSPKEIEGSVEGVFIKDDLEDFVNNPDNTDVVDEIKIITPQITDRTPKICKEVYENGNPYMDFSRAKHINGFELEIKVYHIKEKSLPYMVMDRVEDTLVVCINMLHDYYLHLHENNSQKKAKDEFYLNCVFDAISELNTYQNNYGGFTPDQIRIAKDTFLRNYVEGNHHQ